MFNNLIINWAHIIINLALPTLRSYPEMVLYPRDKFYFEYFLSNPPLLADGSNFIYWYKKLREALKHNNILYVIEQRLEEEPEDSASEEEDEEFRLRRDIFIEV